MSLRLKLLIVKGADMKYLNTYSDDSEPYLNICSDWRRYKVIALIALCKRIFTGKFGKKMNIKDNNSLTRGTHLWTAWELGDSISVMARVRFRFYEVDLLSIWYEMWKAFPAKKNKSFFSQEDSHLCLPFSSQAVVEPV